MKLLGVEDISELGTPQMSVSDSYLDWFDPRELDTLYKQFNAMDQDQDGFITRDEFRQGLGTIMNDDVLADALFEAIDAGRDDKIDFKEYLDGMIILTKEEPTHQLEYAFKLYSPDSSGSITREQFEKIVNSIARSLGSIEFDSKGFIERIFDGADEDKQNRINSEQYCKIASKYRVFIQSLGLLEHVDEPPIVSTENSILTSTRQGIPITFGHESWDLSWHMMHGIRLAVAEVTASQSRSSRDVERKDYDLTVEFEMKSFSKSSDPWMFRDYAPVVFHHIRSVCGVKPNYYLFSMGPEKILGNLLLGNVSALCEMVSTGRSGSFFFKTMDGRYLIKTLSSEEHTLLQRILPDYFLYIKSQPNTLLTRFFGSHSMKKSSERDIHFVVMENLFSSPLFVHEQYDLKGSTVGRHVEIEGNPFVARKDNDFTRIIRVGPQQKAKLLEQIENDVKWLEQHGLCDYSLLVGFHFLNEEERRWVKQHPHQIVGFETQSIFKKYLGGILSEDKTEVYFLGIIDTLTTYSLTKMGEYWAKSLVHDSTEISAIKPAPYRARFQKYVNSIIE